MKFNSKLYFNGIDSRHSNKTGKDYYVLKLYDFDSNSPFEIFVESIDSFKDYKPMQLYDFNLQVTKQNDLINLRLV